MRGRNEDERADGLAVPRGEAHGDCSAVGVAQEDGAVEVEVGEDAADLIGGGGEAGVEVVAALRLAGAGEVEGDDMQPGVELLHEGNEGVGAAHEAVKEDERRLVLHRPSLFEVREAKAIELKMTALHHDEEIPLFRLLTGTGFGRSIDRLINAGELKVLPRSTPNVKDT